VPPTTLGGMRTRTRDLTLLSSAALLCALALTGCSAANDYSSTDTGGGSSVDDSGTDTDTSAGDTDANAGTTDDADSGTSGGDPSAPVPTTVVGVWIAPDGSTAFINPDGSCVGMYYNNGQPLDIGGPSTCAYSGSTLVVSQPPNRASYKVSFGPGSVTITSSGTNVTFTAG